MKYPKEALVLFTEKGFVDENHNNANLIAIQFSYLIISMNCRWMTKTSFAKVWDRYKKELTFIRKTAPITEGLVYGSPEYEEMIRDVPYHVLWMDNHKSHIYDASVLRDMRYHRVIACCFVPHTTHISQALDSGLFTAAKACELSTLLCNLRCF